MVSLISQISQFRSFIQDRLVKINLLASLVLNIIIWTMLAWQTKFFPELITLHYNIYFGIDLLGYWYQIFLLPALGLIVFLLNSFFAILLFNKEKIISYFLVGATTLIQVLLLLATISIISVNS